jgi:hypothetical protein
VSEVEIEIDRAGAVESVARIAEGAIIYDAVAVVVCTGGGVYGLAGIEREAVPTVKRFVKCDELRRSNLWRRSLSERAQSAAGS